MIFAKKKILVWCDDPPEDPVISIFAGCLANHDRAHSLQLIEFHQVGPGFVTGLEMIYVSSILRYMEMVPSHRYHFNES